MNFNVYRHYVDIISKNILFSLKLKSTAKGDNSMNFFISFSFISIFFFFGFQWNNIPFV